MESALDFFRKHKALLDGHFLLSSGLHSPNYLQSALLLQDPKTAAELCAELAKKFESLKPTVVVGPALGGVIVAYETARVLGVKGIFAERSDGKMCLRRGFTVGKDDRVLICEDVITTGKSTMEVVDVITGYGAAVIGIGCIADRTGGKAAFNAPLKSLARVDIPAYKPDACPLCKEGRIPLVKPGSRPRP